MQHCFLGRSTSLVHICESVHDKFFGFWVPMWEHYVGVLAYFDHSSANHLQNLQMFKDIAALDGKFYAAGVWKFSESSDSFTIQYCCPRSS